MSSSESGSDVLSSSSEDSDNERSMNRDLVIPSPMASVRVSINWQWRNNWPTRTLRRIQPSGNPLDKYPIIAQYISRYTKTSFLIIVYLGIYKYERKTMTPKLGTVYDFSIMFEHVLRHLPWQYIVWWNQKWRKKVWRKRIRVTPYIYVYTVMYWVYPSIYNWFCV